MLWAGWRGGGQIKRGRTSREEAVEGDVEKDGAAWLGP